MRYYLFAHNNKNYVKKGDKVKIGDYIGEIGTGGGDYSAHLHLSVYDNLTIPQLKAYVNGWSLEKIKEFYFDPAELFNINTIFDEQVDVGNRGWDWLDNYGSGFHPGVDINGLKGGNTDLGLKFKSPVEGEVIEASDWGKGWGLVLIIINKNDMSENHEVKEISKVAKELFGIETGARINKNEDAKIADAIKKLSEKKQEKGIYVDQSLSEEIARIYPEFTSDSESSHKKAAGKLHECISGKELLEKEKEVWIETEAKLKEDHKLEITNTVLEGKETLDKEISKIHNNTQTIVDNLNDAHDREIEKIRKECKLTTDKPVIVEGPIVIDEPVIDAKKIKVEKLKEAVNKFLELIGIKIK